MKCSYHPAQELTPHLEKAPVFAAVSPDSPAKGFTRRILKCPVPGCPIVASTQDQPKTERICAECKLPIYGESKATYASRDICKPCRIEMQAKRRLTDMRRRKPQFTEVPAW